MQVRPYEQAFRADWDAFISTSNNGTFLFQRAYMEYHADRFEDASFVIRDANERIVALFPASRKGSSITSHGGLTYGGLVTSGALPVITMLRIGEALANVLSAAGVSQVRYKAVPRIYYKRSADADLYFLFRARATLARRDVLTVVEPRLQIRYEERRRRGVKRAEAAGVSIQETGDLAAYWKVLNANLSARHGVSPVHTLDEIERLRALFPQHIRFFGAYAKGDLVAGVVVYESERVAHVQYIASSTHGRELCALDLLFHTLISRVYLEKPYFDFGISTEDEGRTLNEGLVTHKEGFGGTAVVHDHYDWTVAR